MVSYRVTRRCTLQGNRSSDLISVQQVSFQGLPYYLLTPLWTTSYHKINWLQDKKVVSHTFSQHHCLTGSDTILSAHHDSLWPHCSSFQPWWWAYAWKASHHRANSDSCPGWEAVRAETSCWAWQMLHTFPHLHFSFPHFPFLVIDRPLLCWGFSTLVL